MTDNFKLCINITPGSACLSSCHKCHLYVTGGNAGFTVFNIVT